MYTCMCIYSHINVYACVNLTLSNLSSCPGYFQEPHWLSMGLLEISRVSWQVCTVYVCACEGIYWCGTSPQCKSNVASISQELSKQLLTTATWHRWLHAIDRNTCWWLNASLWYLHCISSGYHSLATIHHWLCTRLYYLWYLAMEILQSCNKPSLYSFAAPLLSTININNSCQLLFQQSNFPLWNGIIIGDLNIKP